MADDKDPIVYPSPGRMDVVEGARLLDAGRARVRINKWARESDFAQPSIVFDPPTSRLSNTSSGPSHVRSLFAEPERGGLGILPGCTLGHDDTWNLSSSMLKTYIAMRGGQVKSDDALLAWINKKEHLGRLVKPGQPSLIRDIENAVTLKDSWNDTPSKRKETFVIERPETEHIHAPQGYNIDLHKTTAARRDDGWHQTVVNDAGDQVALGDDISDDEGYPVDARISPCTFRTWAQGVRRWDCDQPEKPKAKNVRLRPTTPTRRPHVHKERLAYYQWDEEDGQQLSPLIDCDSVSEMFFTPPGVSPQSMSRVNRRGMFDRMNPQAGREMRERMFTEPGPFNAPAASRDEHYGEDEVNEVIAREWELDPNQLWSEIKQKWTRVDEVKQREQALYDEIEGLRWENRQLDPENAMLGDCLVEQRNERVREANRGLRIQQHVYHHMREVEVELSLSERALQRAENELAAVDQENSELLLKKEELLRAFGKETPQEVFDLYPGLFLLDREWARRDFVDPREPGLFSPI